MKIGTYYYPEQWPSPQWERDFDNMAALGMQIVHMGEFAWFQMEPAPGDIRLDWLDECIDMAAKRGMQVMLCTPTAAPPIWLAGQHPEILPVDAAGVPFRFGGRRHYCPTAPALHDATTRIVTALAQRYCGNKQVMGWQIDNEYGSGGVFHQNDHAHAAFRRWLQERYQSIDKLNAAWGCQFWNTYYTDFSQIQLPVSRQLRYDNPHQRLDASRFWSWAYAQFNKLQADILRRHIQAAGTGQFITHNFESFNSDVSAMDFAADVDLLSWNAYPVYGQDKTPTGESYRMGDPAGIGLLHEIYRSCNGRFAQTELQLGQVNWADTPNLLYPGTVRLWLWSAFAHGAEFVTTYRYRRPRFGTELFHDGIVGPDGTTPTPGGRQFAQVIDELSHLKLDEPSPAPAQPEVGLVFDFEQHWYFAILPQTSRWHYLQFLQKWYAAITRLGLRVRVLQASQPWPQDLPLIIAPALQLADESLMKKMDQYASAGGHLLLTCRSALMDRHGQLWEGPTAAPLVRLIGGSVEAYDSLPGTTLGQLEMDDKTYAWGIWGELLYSEPTTRVLAKYADQFYAGAAAVIQARCGKGLVTYCGVNAEQPFIDALLERLIVPPAPPEAAAPKRRRRKEEPVPTPPPQPLLPITLLPDKTELLRRGRYWIFLNFRDSAVEAPAPPSVTFVVGQRTVDPAGVAVWEEPRAL